MALFGGMFGGGQKHPNLDQLSLAIHNSLNLQLAPPGDDVLAVTDVMTTTISSASRTPAASRACRSCSGQNHCAQPLIRRPNAHAVHRHAGGD